MFLSEYAYKKEIRSGYGSLGASSGRGNGVGTIGRVGRRVWILWYANAKSARDAKAV